MTRVEKLSICGIRSFSPDVPQVVEFQHPLTVFVGPNGAGKTTIIECLKYATTGDRPLNAKMGTAFVYDLKFLKVKQVNAQVCLDCRNLQGCPITVERNLRVAQSKNGKPQLKTVDNIFQKERSGKRTHLNAKIKDLNSYMVETLGVSKAVLENVIFCHQEEATWPLSDGKSVKQRFDEIFEATRYIKALDNIRDIRKQQKNDRAKEEEQLEGLRQNCEKGVELTKKKQETNNKLLNAQNGLECARKQLVPLEQQRAEISRHQEKVTELKLSLDQSRSRISRKVDECEKLKMKIKREFQRTDDLRNMRDEQSSWLEDKEKQLKDLEEKIEHRDRENLSLMEKQNELSAVKGKLQHEVDAAALEKRKLDDYVRSCTQIYQLEVAVGRDHNQELSENLLDNFGSAFSLRIKEEKTKVQNQNKQELETLGKQYLKITAENSSSLPIASNNRELELLQGRLEKTEDDLRTTEMASKVKELEDDISKLKSEENELQTKMLRLDDEIDEILKSAENRTQIEIYRQIMSNKEDIIKSLKQKHQRQLEAIELAGADSFPDEWELTAWLENKENEVKTVQRKLDERRVNLDALYREVARSGQSSESNRITDEMKITHELEVELNKLNEEENKGKHCLPDVVQIRNATLEIYDLNDKIQLLESRVPVTSLKSISEWKAKRNQLHHDWNRVNREIEKKRREISVETSAVNSKLKDVNAMLKEKVQLISDRWKREQLQMLSADIKRIRTEMEESDTQRQQVERERNVTELESKKSSFTPFSDETNKKSAQNLKHLQQTFQYFLGLVNNQREFEKSGKKAALQSKSKEIETTRDEIKKSNEEMSLLQKDKSDIEKYCAAYDEQQRDLAKEKENAAKVEWELHGMQVDKLEKKSSKLKDDCESLKNEINQSIFTQERLQDDLAELEGRLAKDKYRDADKLYRQTKRCGIVLDLASKDLGIFYEALDHAIMQFHRLKMLEINNIMKKRWSQTYRGKDIDYIKIESEASTGSSDSRRSFNYRVVMNTRGVDMDMRGRCSAGQKVLASLVIRLALAETFCLNCGILALDEPTTNLDRDNVESLAEALVTVIQERDQRRNLQLMIITHDEDFVEMLERTQRADCFFRITKDERGTSIIERRNK